MRQGRQRFWGTGYCQWREKPWSLSVVVSIHLLLWGPPLMHGMLIFSFTWAPAIAVEPLKGGSSLKPCQEPTFQLSHQLLPPLIWPGDPMQPLALWPLFHTHSWKQREIPSSLPFPQRPQVIEVSLLVSLPWTIMDNTSCLQEIQKTNTHYSLFILPRGRNWYRVTNIYSDHLSDRRLNSPQS